MFLLLQLPYPVRQADVNQYRRHYYLVPPQSLSRKQIKNKPMLCKPLFIVHGRVKGFLKVKTTVQKQSASVAKVSVVHA